MDFSVLNDTLVSKSYNQITDICHTLTIQVSSQGVVFQDEWPYAIHILGHIYINVWSEFDVNSDDASKNRECIISSLTTDDEHERDLPVPETKASRNSARFLWKRIPMAVKESQPKVLAAWKIGQKLWTRAYAGVHEAIREFNWSPEAQGIVASFSELYTERMFELLVSAYSTISTQDTALFPGLNVDDAANYALERGWTLDHASQMLTVKKQVVATEQKLDSSKLQCLTEYVFHLEH